VSTLFVVFVGGVFCYAASAFAIRSWSPAVFKRSFKTFRFNDELDKVSRIFLSAEILLCIYLSDLSLGSPADRKKTNRVPSVHETAANGLEEESSLKGSNIFRLHFV